MNRFPLCIDLQGKTVILVGNGPQIQDKAEKLAPFEPVLLRRDCFTQADAALEPAMVIVGDTDLEEAQRIFALCRDRGIAVNVVDVPRLCSFHFPALIHRGDLTVSVSTGGSSPAVAAFLRRKLEENLPENTEEILNWLSACRGELKQRQILHQAVEMAFLQRRPLTEAELWALEKK